MFLLFTIVTSQSADCQNLIEQGHGKEVEDEELADRLGAQIIMRKHWRAHFSHYGTVTRQRTHCVLAPSLIFIIFSCNLF